MRARYVVVVVVLAGCYQPSFRDNQPCTETGQCPPGQVCGGDQVCRSAPLDGGGDNDAQRPDAAVRDAGIDGPPGDRDNDRVVDGSDNCPGAFNPDQDNEDGDDHGDACDNCPHVFNDDQANVLEGQTRDDVGDACDPNPTLPGDEIAFFDNFNDLAEDVWRRVDSTAAAQGDGRLFLQPAGGGVGDLILITPIDAFMVVVRARANETNGDQVRGFGVWIGASDAGPVTGFLCEQTTALPAPTPPFPRTGMRLVDVGATRAVVQEVQGLPFGTFQIMLRRDLNNPRALSCRQSGAGGGGPGDPEPRGEVTLGSGRVGLRALGLTARFDWIVVFRRKAP